MLGKPVIVKGVGGKPYFSKWDDVLRWYVPEVLSKAECSI